MFRRLFEDIQQCFLLIVKRVKKGKTKNKANMRSYLLTFVLNNVLINKQNVHVPEALLLFTIILY
jgi:hypothetical protein